MEGKTSCPGEKGVTMALAVLVLLGSGLAASDERQQEKPWARITVDVTRPLGEVNNWILGSNILGYQVNAWWDAKPEYHDYGSGVWDPQAGRPVAEMVDLARSAGLSVARWPGGCGTHLFDWKKTIGPLQQRPLQQFGLPEFLRFCAAADAVPLITLADYYGTAQDAADLVEYLNAPDDASHPWARRRAEDGHPEPWDVVWFEYGNESEHGDHRGHKMTAQEYARNYLAYRSAMKAVDRRVQLGAVVATAFPDLDLHQWAPTVLEIVGPQLDFAIHHAYKPAYYRNDGEPDAKTLFRIALAGSDQIQHYYDEMRALLRRTTERDDVPVAVTEFNGHFWQEKPIPYRHSLGNALVNAEMLRVFMNPANKIIMANFWQFSNEHWGAVKGYVHKGDPLVKRPQYYVFQLYHRHFGAQLLPAKVEPSTYETAGGYGVRPARGAGNKYRLLAENILPEQEWALEAVAGARHTVADDVLEVEFVGEDVDYYHACKRLPAQPEMGYRLTGWVTTEDIGPGEGISLELIEARGWEAGAARSGEISGTTDWQRVEVRLVTFAPDTRELMVRVRRMSGRGPVKGKARFRDLRVQQCVPRVFPAVSHVAANASRSRDGNTVYLIVVNKSLDEATRGTISLKGFPGGRARVWLLTGPGPAATNEHDPSNVSVTSRDLGRVGSEFSFAFPPCSLTALEVEREAPAVASP